MIIRKYFLIHGVKPYLSDFFILIFKQIIKYPYRIFYFHIKFSFISPEENRNSSHLLVH